MVELYPLYWQTCMCIQLNKIQNCICEELNFYWNQYKVLSSLVKAGLGQRVNVFSSLRGKSESQNMFQNHTVYQEPVLPTCLYYAHVIGFVREFCHYFFITIALCFILQPVTQEQELENLCVPELFPLFHAFLFPPDPGRKSWVELTGAVISEA